MAAIATTTINSIRVKPETVCLRATLAIFLFGVSDGVHDSEVLRANLSGVGPEVICA